MRRLLTRLRPTTTTRRPVASDSSIDLLQAVHVRGEGGEEDAPAARLEDAVQTAAHAALRAGRAGVLDVGRVGEQQQHAARAVLGEGLDVGPAAVDRRVVDLEVAGVDDDAAAAW